MVSMRPSPLSLSLLKDAGPKGTLCRGTRSTGTALDQHVDSYESLGTSRAEPWAAAPHGGQDPPQPVTSSPSRGSLIWGRRCRGLLASRPTPVYFLGTSQRCLGEGREVGVTWGGSVCHPPPSSSPADPGSPTLPQGPPVEVHHVPDDQLRL